MSDISLSPSPSSNSTRLSRLLWQKCQPDQSSARPPSPRPSSVPSCSIDFCFRSAGGCLNIVDLLFFIYSRVTCVRKFGTRALCERDLGWVMTTIDPSPRDPSSSSLPIPRQICWTDTIGFFKERRSTASCQGCRLVCVPAKLRKTPVTRLLSACSCMARW